MKRETLIALMGFELLIKLKNGRILIGYIDKEGHHFIIVDEGGYTIDGTPAFNASQVLCFAHVSDLEKSRIWKDEDGNYLLP